jgi:hypothetical protein
MDVAASLGVKAIVRAEQFDKTLHCTSAFNSGPETLPTMELRWDMYKNLSKRLETNPKLNATVGIYSTCYKSIER